MQILNSNRKAISFNDVLLVPSYSTVRSRNDVDLSWSIKQYHFKSPIISANMDTITGPRMVAEMDNLGGLGILHRNMSIEKLKNFVEPIKGYSTLALSVGCVAKDSERINYILEETRSWIRSPILCIDIANGFSSNMTDTIRYIRSLKFDGVIIAGNVCTPEAVAILLDSGADLIKVGVGPGSVCITREEAGVGYPQLEAVYNCAKVGPIIADGGIKTPGDAAKCLAVGAKAVMLGGALAGTDCVPGWHIPDGEGLAFLSFRGSASREAQEAAGCPVTSVEGKSLLVPMRAKGSTRDVVKRYEAGIKSAMSYSDSRTIKEFYKKAKIVHISPTSVQENGAHF